MPPTRIIKTMITSQLSIGGGNQVATINQTTAMTFKPILLLSFISRSILDYFRFFLARISTVDAVHFNIGSFDCQTGFLKFYWWRRGWDSNPRWNCSQNAFRERRRMTTWLPLHKKSRVPPAEYFTLYTPSCFKSTQSASLRK